MTSVVVYYRDERGFDQSRALAHHAGLRRTGGSMRALLPPIYLTGCYFQDGGPVLLFPEGVTKGGAQGGAGWTIAVSEASRFMA